MSYIGNQPVPQSTRTIQEFTVPSGGQTTFATAGYVPNFIQVTLNGIRLAATDYTATNGSDVVLTTAAAEGDVLCVDMQNELVDVGAGFASTSEVQGIYTTATTAKATNANQLTSVTAVSGYNLADVSVGDYVTGEGILVGTTVSAISGTTITLYHPDGDALSSSMTDLSGDPVSFYNSTKALSAGTVAGGLCRAWVNFDGNPVAIRASFNVSSVADNGGSGDYTITFATAMPDENYCVVFGGSYTSGTTSSSAGGLITEEASGTRSTTQLQIASRRKDDGANYDTDFINVAIFR
jgi:hypothetical protein